MMKSLKKGGTDIYSCPTYKEMYRKSLENPEEFWTEVGNCITWTKPWRKVLDDSNAPFTKWFVDGRLNACYNAVDRHVHSGRGDKVALIHDSPLTNTQRKVTYVELLEKVSRLSGALAKLGVSKGDRVVIYMPAIPETVMAMLAVVRLGAVHCVVFGGYAAVELANRIEHAQPKVIIAANCGIEPNKIIKYKEFLNIALKRSTFKPFKCIIFERRDIEVASLNDDIDILWDSALNDAEPHPCVSIEANDPFYILHTSGTTGKPKAVQRSVGGHLAVLAWTMRLAFGMRSGDVWWATSDLGWVFGHSYICYGPLVSGVTSIIYEGKPDNTPDSHAYARILEKYQVNAVSTVPSVLRIIKSKNLGTDFRQHYNLKNLKQIFVGSELMDSDVINWTQYAFGVPVLNQWWQTETGSPITITCTGIENFLHPPKLSAGLPFPGHDVKVMAINGTEAKPHELGRLVIKLPLPPGCASTLYRAHDKFCKLYFTKYPGYFDTMDVGYVDQFGYVYITSRDDDGIKVAGHRLSTAAIEDVIIAHPDVIDAAVIGGFDSIKGQTPIALFVMRQDAILDEKHIGQELVSRVRECIGPVASFRLSVAVKELPRSRSGKICRKYLSDLANDRLFKIPECVENPAVFKDIAEAFKRIGFVSNVPDLINCP